jgi:soluble lytic murein transglycosylase
VVSPISRARAAYWAGRATEAMGNAKEAEEWYRAAAYHPTTYYGQLAAAQIHPDRVLRLPPPHVASAEERREFGRHEVVRAVRILHQVGAKDHLKPFVLRLAELPDGPAWPTLVGELVDSLHRPELAVLTAKRANRFGYEMLHSGYPTVPAPPADDRGKGRRLEAGLINAVVRQESAFNPVAVSVAGARGLMQLLPETAKKVASGINLRFSKDRLTGDPEYNLRLGQAYLADLVDEFAGSYVLALAAYNAGPSRARQWMRENGDPRDRSVDVVDWIEMIPFEETRNYVQRVLEALQVYRLRSSGREVAMGLPGDLTR